MVSYLEESPLGGQELQLSQDASSSVASERALLRTAKPSQVDDPFEPASGCSPFTGAARLPRLGAAVEEGLKGASSENTLFWKILVT
jgi:hypothetical protein